jgi:hypothetical protein
VWTCPECTLPELPFFNVKDFEILERKPGLRMSGNKAHRTPNLL